METVVRNPIVAFALKLVVITAGLVVYSIPVILGGAIIAKLIW